MFENKKQKKMLDFFHNVQKTCDSLPSSKDSPQLSGLERVLYIINTNQAIYSFPYGMGDRAYMMYQESSSGAGLVYNGQGIPLRWDFAVPHVYGEISYRSTIGGNLFYCGHFNKGMLSGEGRLSIESTGHTYNGIFSSELSQNRVNVRFSSLG